MTMSRTPLIRNFRIAARPKDYVATRTFFASSQQYRTVTDTVKDAAKTVDRTVSQAAIKGLDGVEKASEIAKGMAEKVGINTEMKSDPLLDDIETEGGTTDNQAQAKGEQKKGDTKEKIRNTAGKAI